MKVFAALFIYFCCFSFAFASEKFSLTVDRMPVQQLVMLHYDNCEKRGIVFDSSAQKFDEQITMKTGEIGCADSRALIAEVLARSSLTLMRRSAFDFLTKSKEIDEAADWTDFIYRPRFRDPNELAQIAGLVVRRGSFSHQRRSSVIQSTASASVAETGTNGASIVEKVPDKLVFFGPASEISSLNSLFSRIDIPYPQIELEASIFEFQRGKADADAVSAALKLFGSRLGLNLNAAITPNASSLKLSFSNMSVAVDLLDKDSRFKYVSRPKVIVKDGEEASFIAGQDVRVVGQTVVSNGQATQSITTLTAGITLVATPRIRADVVDVTLRQLVSDFAPSPNSDISIVRRELNSRLSMTPGTVYLVGGLKTNRRTQTKNSFFGFETSSSSDIAETEVLLLLTVRRDEISM